MQQVRRDPAPSLLAYRLHRLWLRPMVRALVRIGLPACLLLLAAGFLLADPDRRGALAERLSQLRARVEGLEQLRVTRLEINGAGALAGRIRERLAPALPASALSLDLAALRGRVTALPGVRGATLRVAKGGILEAAVTARRPVALWRRPGGALVLLDSTGDAYAPAGKRAAHPELPVLAGAGAPDAMGEARRILAAAGPLTGRVRALMRVGRRRWDLALTGDLRIMLPGGAPVAALDRVIALAEAPAVRLLDRDLRAVDMRIPDRPTLRLPERAAGMVGARRDQRPGDGARGG